MKKITRAFMALSIILVAGECAADTNPSASGDPPAQPSAQAPVQAVAPAAVGSAASAAPAANAPAGTAANTQAPASKPGRKVLVDNTVNDAQLKQILSRGYRPEAQARGNEVYYCRSEHTLGSRFDSKACRTAAQILGDEALGKEATANTERTGGNPSQK